MDGSRRAVLARRRRRRGDRTTAVSEGDDLNVLHVASVVAPLTTTALELDAVISHVSGTHQLHCSQCVERIDSVRWLLESRHRLISPHRRHETERLVNILGVDLVHIHGWAMLAAVAAAGPLPVPSVVSLPGVAHLGRTAVPTTAVSMLLKRAGVGAVVTQSGELGAAATAAGAGSFIYEALVPCGTAAGPFLDLPVADVLATGDAAGKHATTGQVVVLVAPPGSERFAADTTALLERRRTVDVAFVSMSDTGRLSTQLTSQQSGGGTQHVGPRPGMSSRLHDARSALDAVKACDLVVVLPGFGESTAVRQLVEVAQVAGRAILAPQRSSALTVVDAASFTATSAGTPGGFAAAIAALLDDSARRSTLSRNAWSAARRRWQRASSPSAAEQAYQCVLGSVVPSERSATQLHMAARPCDATASPCRHH